MVFTYILSMCAYLHTIYLHNYVSNENKAQLCKYMEIVKKMMTSDPYYSRQ